MGQLLTHRFITRSNKNILNRLIYCFTLPLRSDVQTIIVETVINLWYCAIYAFILHQNFPVVISYFMPWSDRVLHYLYTHLPAWCDTCCHRVQFPWVTIYNYVAIAHMGLYTSDIGLGRCCMGNIRMHLKHGSRDGIMASSDGSGWSRAFAGIILQWCMNCRYCFPEGPDPSGNWLFITSLCWLEGTVLLQVTGVRHLWTIVIVVVKWHW